MANQMESGTIGGAASESASMQAAVASQREAALSSGAIGHGEVAAQGRPASQTPYPAFHGRRISWIAVAVIVVGFLAGGLAMVFGHQGPIWWLFWAGLGVSVLGFLMMLATNTFEDWY